MALGWAVIGTGLHVDHKIAPAINAAPDAELVAVCSRDQDRAEACAAKHGARAAYSDLGAMLRTRASMPCSSPLLTPCTRGTRAAGGADRLACVLRKTHAHDTDDVVGWSPPAEPAA